MPPKSKGLSNGVRLYIIEGSPVQLILLQLSQYAGKADTVGADADAGSLWSSALQVTAGVAGLLKVREDKSDPEGE